MEIKAIDGLTLFFRAEEQETAKIIESACRRSIQVINDLWGLGVPEDCRVYVMDSWKYFVFHSAPWPWRILLTGTMPFWVPRVKKVWLYAGGWAQRYGKRRAVGVKPLRLIEAAERSIGERIFIPGADLREKVRRIFCHELTHAFTAHLRLPAWLNEGLAMVTVDRMSGGPTVRRETLKSLDDRSGREPKGYGSLRASDEEALVYHYVRGYWITRYLMDSQREVLRNLLGRRQSRIALERALAARFGTSRQEFWMKIDGLVASHFRQSEE